MSPDDYCNVTGMGSLMLEAVNMNASLIVADESIETTDVALATTLSPIDLITTMMTALDNKTLATQPKPKPKPNAALMSFVMMIGTFFIAYFLRGFRNSQFLGRTVKISFRNIQKPRPETCHVGATWLGL